MKTLQIGDKTTIKIDAESRSWGNNPAPDGTEVEIVGWNEIHQKRNHGYKRPGVYENHCWPLVKLPNGKTIYINSCHLTGHTGFGGEFLRDLPETPFWESDIVLFQGQEKEVANLHYEPNDVRYDIYLDASRCGWHSMRSESELTLVRRGMIWKHFHGEAIEFASLEEECRLARTVGETEDVRNPANQLYKWTKDEVLAAIQAGTADGLGLGQTLMSTNLCHQAIRFTNRDLGERVRKATLEGFGIK